MKNIKDFQDLINASDFNSKIQIYFGTKVAGADFDPYEKNYTESFSNPQTIKGLVKSISPEALTWRKYGIAETGAVVVFTLKKYRSWFEIAKKIVIDGSEYAVYKSGTGGDSTIQELKGNFINVVLQKV